MVSYFLFITLKNILSLVFLILKALKDILQHFKLVNWWFRFFDVTNSLIDIHQHEFQNKNKFSSGFLLHSFNFMRLNDNLKTAHDTPQK